MGNEPTTESGDTPDTSQQPRQLLFNGRESTVASREELRTHLQAAREMPFAELWLDNDKPNSLALLLNTRYQRAYLEADGHSVQSCSSDYTGEEIKADLRREWEADGEEWTEEDEEEPASVEFLLSNGQIDEIEPVRTVPAEDGLRAFEHFFLYGIPDPSVGWQRTQSIPEVMEQLSGHPTPD